MKDDKVIAQRELELIADDTMQVITLTPNFKLSGTVINAVTKEAVSSYVVQTVTFSSALLNARGNAQPDSFKTFLASDFSLEVWRHQNILQNVYRFDVPGFRTYRTPRYSVDGPPASLTVELQPTEVQSGRIMNSDGTPAAFAKVSIARPEDALMIDSVSDFCRTIKCTQM